MSDLKTIRTDVVGSLLRPAAVLEARARFDEGQFDAGGLRAIEEKSGAKVVEVRADDSLSPGQLEVDVL